MSRDQQAAMTCWQIAALRSVPCWDRGFVGAPAAPFCQQQKRRPRDTVLRERRDEPHARE